MFTCNTLESMWYGKKKNCQFCKNRCQQPQTDDSYDWKVSVLDNKTIQKTLFIIDEALLTWTKKIRKNYILRCSKNTTLLMTSHCRTLRLKFDVQLVCTKSQGQSFLKYNKLHTYITLTAFFRQLTDDKICSYFMLDNVTAQRANF